MFTSALKTVSATGLGLTMALTPPVEVEPRVLVVGKPGPVASGYFKLGANKDPEGREISVNCWQSELAAC